MTACIQAPPASDTVDISSTDYTPRHRTEAVYVGTSASNNGSLVVQHAKDVSTRTYTNVPQGSYIIGEFKKIIRSGTSVSNMIVVYMADQGAAGL